MGGTGGSIDRALGEAQRLTGAAGTAENLRRLMVPGLATWDPTANAAKRLVALESELIGGQRALLAPLANALVANRLLTRGSSSGANTLEVAHEALLRREPIASWLDAQKDDLKLRDDVLKEAADWSGSGRHDEGLVRRGARLEAARALLADNDFATTLGPAKDYLAACKRLETAGLRKARRARMLTTTLMLGTIAALLGVIFKEQIGDIWFEQTTVRNYIAKEVKPHVLTADKEHALKPRDTFRECAKDCPEMVVVPSGSFQMGSPDSEAGRHNAEGPVHTVTIAKPFAVGKFTVTWDDWEACVAMRGCDGKPTGDATFGKGPKPVINVTWDQAQAYVGWLSRMTGRQYRLLTEAEWEYAARSGSQTAYWFGNDPAEICKYANLADKSFKQAGYGGDSTDCDDGQANTAPVGSYPANAFDLSDMHGNVWQWVQDGWHDNYKGDPPSDGTEWLKDADTSRRVVRGGSWLINPGLLRSAIRGKYTSDSRNGNLGFRVGRTLTP